jgi:hypothetical protein
MTDGTAAAASELAGNIETARNGKKQMILNAFVMNTRGHLAAGQWRNPRNKTDQ